MNTFLSICEKRCVWNSLNCSMCKFPGLLLFSLLNLLVHHPFIILVYIIFHMRLYRHITLYIICNLSLVYVLHYMHQYHYLPSYAWIFPIHLTLITSFVTGTSPAPYTTTCTTSFSFLQQSWHLYVTSPSSALCIYFTPWYTCHFSMHGPSIIRPVGSPAPRAAQIQQCLTICPNSSLHF